MGFFDDEEKIEALLDDEGFPRDQTVFDRTARPIYDMLREYAHSMGCDCDFSLFIVAPFEHFIGMQIVHEQTCIGQMKMKGRGGHN